MPELRFIDWGAQDVRATIFATAPTARIDDLFADAFGGRPEVYHQPSSLHDANAGAHASGGGPLGQMMLQRQPGRFDVSLQPSPSTSHAPPGSPPGEPHHPLILKSREAVDFIRQATMAILPRFPNINRLACGITLCVPAASASGASSLLNDVLPFDIKIGEESDFMLRYNCKIRIPVRDQTVNSISLWQVAPIQQINIFHQGVAPANNTLGQVINTYFLAQKVIDINTQPAPEILDGQDAVATLDALISRVHELMTISD